MRVAVIGAGRIGSMHASTLANISGVDQIAVADARAPAAARLAERVNGIALTDPAEIWTGGFDGVVIASPTATHFKCAMAGIEAGLAVFCEKPLSNSLIESKQIARRLGEGGPPFMVGLQRRFDPTFLTIRERIQHGDFGQLYLTRIKHGDVGPPPPGYLSCAGKMFLDQCIHDFDAIRWLVQAEVESVTCIAARRTDSAEVAEHDDVDTILASLVFTNGSLGMVQALRHSAPGYSIEVEVSGSLGGVSAGHTRPPGHEVAAPSAPYGFLERFAQAYEKEMVTFARLIVGELESPSTAADAVAAARIAMAAERSFLEGRTVRMTEI